MTEVLYHCGDHLFCPLKPFHAAINRHLIRVLCDDNKLVADSQNFVSRMFVVYTERRILAIIYLSPDYLHLKACRQRILVEIISCSY